MLAHLGNGRSADAVRDSLINTVHQMPEALRGTLTWAWRVLCCRSVASPCADVAG